jgi:hypothetical protein
MLGQNETGTSSLRHLAQLVLATKAYNAGAHRDIHGNLLSNPTITRPYYAIARDILRHNVSQSKQDAIQELAQFIIGHKYCYHQAVTRAVLALERAIQLDPDTPHQTPIASTRQERGSLQRALLTVLSPSDIRDISLKMTEILTKSAGFKKEIPQYQQNLRAIGNTYKQGMRDGSNPSLEPYRAFISKILDTAEGASLETVTEFIRNNIDHFPVSIIDAHAGLKSSSNQFHYYNDNPEHNTMVPDGLKKAKIAFKRSLSTIWPETTDEDNPMDSFQFQVDELCKSMAADALSDHQKEALVGDINVLLGDTLQPVLSAQNIGIATDSLMKAITTTYPKGPDEIKLRNFLEDLAIQMGETYPLKTPESPLMKVVNSISDYYIKQKTIADVKYHSSTNPQGR